MIVELKLEEHKYSSSLVHNCKRSEKKRLVYIERSPNTELDWEERHLYSVACHLEDSNKVSGHICVSKVGATHKSVSETVKGQDIAFKVFLKNRKAEIQFDAPEKVLRDTAAIPLIKRCVKKLSDRSKKEIEYEIRTQLNKILTQVEKKIEKPKHFEESVDNIQEAAQFLSKKIPYFTKDEDLRSKTNALLSNINETITTCMENQSFKKPVQKTIDSYVNDIASFLEINLNVFFPQTAGYKFMRKPLDQKGEDAFSDAIANGILSIKMRKYCKQNDFTLSKKEPE